MSAPYGKGFGYLQRKGDRLVAFLPRRPVPPPAPAPTVSGSIYWAFSGLTFTVIPQRIEIIGTAQMQITYISAFSLPGGPGDYIPLGAYGDAGLTQLISNWNSDMAINPRVEKKVFDLKDTYIVQDGTNYAGNYTARGSTGRIAILIR